MYMRTFLAFFVLYPDHPDPEAAKRMLERAGEFMPEASLKTDSFLSL
jgi:hypothetical protein